MQNSSVVRRKSSTESLQSSSNSLTISFAIILSRVMGILRDQFQAFYFGIGFFATVWEIAIWIPGLLRNFLADGGLARVFIAQYSRTITSSKKEADALSGAVIMGVSFFIVILLVLFYWLAPAILPALVNVQPEEGELLVKISRITLLHLLLISPASLMSRIAHTQKRFAFPSLLEVSQNLLFLLVYASFEFLDILDSGLQLAFLAWALASGSAFQLIAQTLYVRFLGCLPKLNINFRQAGVKKILQMMGPISLGLGAFQLNGFFDLVIASHFIPSETGAIPALRYAARLTALPLAIVSTAIATTILPAISQKIAKKISDGKDELQNATKFSLFLTLPAGIGLFLFGSSIIEVLFERGEWDQDATLATHSALQFLAFSIPIVNINNFLYTYFYAHQQTVVVMRVMITGVAFNLTLNLILVQFLAQGGIALSTTLSSLLVCILLSKQILRERWLAKVRRVFHFIGWKLWFLWSFFGLYLIGMRMLRQTLQTQFPEKDAGELGSFDFSSLWSLWIHQPTMNLITIVGSSILLYFALGWWIRLPELKVFSFFWQRFKKKS